MAEGFFDPADMAVPQVRADRLCAAMVRIRPKTMLVLDIAESQEQADALARNEIHADGSEHWYRFFTLKTWAGSTTPSLRWAWSGMSSPDWSGRAAVFPPPSRSTAEAAVSRSAPTAMC
ncbi:hypothetical protein PEC18_07070 [Paucibacter sp. O1-1]|nr:hypothetical protein [Paucibacter sp. O1-1]MDA3825633.1 hypothetical protein [Paucibacter sp. O1-1]